MAKADYDIVIVSDFRFEEGTAGAVVEEVKAQAAAGYTTGLIHVSSSPSERGGPFARSVIELVQAGKADLISDAAPVRARMLQVRPPGIAEALSAGVPRVEADVKTLVVNSAPFNRDRSRGNYDAASVREALRRRFAEGWVWAPSNPVVREALVEAEAGLSLTPEDWPQIVNADEWLTDRSRYVCDRPVIGLHPIVGKQAWSASSRAILKAYPYDRRFLVRVLGAAAPIMNALGELPPNWRVVGPRKMTFKQFLQTIDFFVHFHHPGPIEGAHHLILGAIASGAPTILPSDCRRIFQESAVYAGPNEVKDVVMQLYRDSAAYKARSERGVQYVRDHFGPAGHLRRVESVIGRPSQAPRLTPPPAAPMRQSVLFVTSNGVGMGHLSRMMALARRLPPHMSAVFLTLSQAMRIVREQGFLAEYFAGWDYVVGPPIHADSAAELARRKKLMVWHHRLERRLLEVFETYNSRAMVFDANVVYDGVALAMRRDGNRPYIWCRRAMWKPGMGEPALQFSGFFHDIIEPGEIAEAVDIGPTAARRYEVVKVAPITWLDESELLDRAEARRAMGLHPDHPAVLIQLGGGNISDIETPALKFIRALSSVPNIQILVAEQIIINQAQAFADHIRKVSVCPLSKYFMAFDFLVAACGYNSFHEAVGFGVPAIFVPRIDDTIEDQVARGRYAQEVGAGLCIEDVTDEAVAAALAIMLDEKKRAAFAGKCRELSRGNGAQAAVQAVLDAIERWPGRREVKPPPGYAPAPGADVPQPSMAGAKPLPKLIHRAIQLGARFALRLRDYAKWRLNRLRLAAADIRPRRETPPVATTKATPAAPAVAPETPHPPILLVVALGLSEEGLLQALERMRNTELIFLFKPLLVISCDKFEIMRKRRHLFEYIPPEDEWLKHRQAESWASFRDKRIAAIIDTYQPKAILVLDDRDSFGALSAGAFNGALYYGLERKAKGRR